MLQIAGGLSLRVVFLSHVLSGASGSYYLDYLAILFQANHVVE